MWIIFAFIVTYENPIHWVIFPCINLFVDVFLVRTWNLLHMDVDTISKDQTSVFSKMLSIPFHSLIPNGLLLAMGFTYPPWNWLSMQSYFLHSHTSFFFKFAALSFALVNTRIKMWDHGWISRSPKNIPIPFDLFIGSSTTVDRNLKIAFCNWF